MQRAPVKDSRRAFEWSWLGSGGGTKRQGTWEVGKDLLNQEDLELWAKEFGFILRAERGLGEHSDWYSRFHYSW